MTPSSWQITSPITAIVFDCDGTLTTLEGIDELANMNGVGPEVSQLTQQAMGFSGINPALFQERMLLVNPTDTQVRALAKEYATHQVPDVKNCIALLQRLNKSIYIVSAGLNPAVMLFGEALGIARTHIFAVDVHFNSDGHYAYYETSSPLVHNDGKRVIVEKIKQIHHTILHIGDGLNDFSTYDLVTRFVGYGGVFYRENIESRCDYYIRSLSLAPLLPLVLTKEECAQLTDAEKILYAKGLNALTSGQVKY